MFARILKQSFSRQRRRKSLAAAAVVLGMAVATAMLTLRVNLGDDLNHELRKIGANIVVTPAADSLPLSLNGVDLRPARSGALLDEAGLGKIKTSFWGNNIVAFAPQLQTSAQVQGRAGAVTVEGTYFDHPVTVPGEGRTITTGIRRLASAWQVDGSWPADDSTQVLAGDKLGIAAGTTLLLTGEGGGAATPVTVSGVLHTGAAEDSELVAPLAVAQRLAGQPGRYRRLLVSAITKPEDAFGRRDLETMSPADRERWSCSPYPESIARGLVAAIPGGVARVVRPVADSEGVVLAKLQLLIFFITGLALLASALAIGSAMAASVMERRHEIALMKAVGARDAAVGQLLLSEAALLGLGGGAAGFLAGEAIAGGIARQILGHDVAWKPALLPIILMLGALVALLGSLPPLRRALRLDPALALRGPR